MRLPNIHLPIETEHLRLRRPTRDDADSRFELQSDPAYVAYVGQPINRQQSDAQLDEELSDSTDYLCVIACVHGDSSMIGECVIQMMTDGEPEIVISILPKYRRSGYGLELGSAIIRACFGDPDIKRIMARVDEANSASIELVQKLAMTRNGLMIDLFTNEQVRRYVIERP